MAAVPTTGGAVTVSAEAASADALAEVLFERFHERVYRYCLYQLGSREEAEDAAQVTFVHALAGLRRGVVPRFEAGWIFAIAKNVCLERRQARGRRRDREVLQDPATLEETAPGAETHGDEAARLREALGQIPEQQREAVLLREWRGLSYREIAAEMGLSLAAVETLIFRARRSLAQRLTDEPENGRARLANGFGLGPLAAALKAGLAGTAAKIAVALGALAAMGVLTGGALLPTDGDADVPRRSVVVPADLPPALQPVFLRPAAAHPSAAPADVTARPTPTGASGQDGTSSDPANGLVDDANGLLDDADGLLEPTREAVDETAAVLEPVLEPLDPVVEPAQSRLDSTLQTATEPLQDELSGLDTDLELP